MPHDPARAESREFYKYVRGASGPSTIVKTPRYSTLG